MKQSKRAMIEAMRKSLGIVSQACKTTQISRETHYKWMKFDDEYRKAIEQTAEEAKDFAETSLFNQVKEGKTQATIFYLEKKCRDRGYGSEPNQLNIIGKQENLNVEISYKEMLEKARREAWTTSNEQ